MCIYYIYPYIVMLSLIRVVGIWDVCMSAPLPASVTYGYFKHVTGLM